MSENEINQYDEESLPERLSGSLQGEVIYEIRGARTKKSVRNRTVVDLCFYAKADAAEFRKANSWANRTLQIRDRRGHHIIFRFKGVLKSVAKIKDAGGREIGQYGPACAGVIFWTESITCPTRINGFLDGLTTFGGLIS
jgi:hypothetical protein